MCSTNQKAPVWDGDIISVLPGRTHACSFAADSHSSKCISPEERLFSVLSWKKFHRTAFKIKKYLMKIIKRNGETGQRRLPGNMKV